MSDPYHRFVYNPERDELGELIPLFARYEVNDLGKIEGYSVSLSNDKPLAYVVSVEEQSFVLAAHFVDKKLKDGTIIDLEAQ